MTGKKMFYSKPAKGWVEALPLGNGRLGAMLYGGFGEEKISLNDDTLWSGYPHEREPRDRSESYRDIKCLVKENRIGEAEALFQRELSSDYSESYQPLGDLLISYEGVQSYDSFSRSLDLETAVYSEVFLSDEIAINKTAFLSYPADALLYRVETECDAGLSLCIGFRSPLHYSVKADGDSLIIFGQCPSHTEPHYIKTDRERIVYDEKDRGIRFYGCLKVKTDGTILSEGETLFIRNAHLFTFAFSSLSDFQGVGKPLSNNAEGLIARVKETVSLALIRSFEELTNEHSHDYSTFYTQSSLCLGEEVGDDRDTGERIVSFYNGSPDQKLLELLYNYGKYLAISSSRPGSKAMNLQGIWNDALPAPWCCNYTLNVNLEMNYWPVLACGMERLQDPFDDLLSTLSITGEKIAREYYGARGFAVHHNSDLWGFAEPVGRGKNNCAKYAFWPLAGAWMCQHLFSRYEYTLDKQYLEKTALPLMEKAVLFYEDIMEYDKEGYFSFIGGVSPENDFVVNGVRHGVALHSTMTDAMVKELYGNYLKALDILNHHSEIECSARKHYADMRPYVIGVDGRILEWDKDYEEFDPHHRHISHLYGLYPGSSIDVENTPALADAARKTLEVRGDDGTGWSLAWKISFWAKLRDGEHCLSIIKKLFTPRYDMDFSKKGEGGGLYPNLFDAHPPFQIDGNFGYVAGINEMLIQSYSDKIVVLPALPTGWKDGSLVNIRLRGGRRASVEWKNGQLVKLVLSGPSSSVCIIYNGNEIKRRLTSSIVLYGKDFF